MLLLCKTQNLLDFLKEAFGPLFFMRLSNLNFGN